MASTDSTPTADDSPPRRTIIVRAGSVTRAIALEEALEVIPARALTRYPAAPPTVAGLANVHGAVVTVLDLGRLLGTQSSNRPDGSILLVSHRGRPVGLAVDDVVDIRGAGDIEDGGSASADATLDLTRLLGEVLAES